MSQDILRKYITYARKECNPQLTNMDRHKIENLYADLRKASMVRREKKTTTLTVFFFRQEEEYL